QQGGPGQGPVLEAAQRAQTEGTCRHTFGCAVQQRHLGGQYFVQGSADVLVLDRKRLLNFYSRHSYSSYCDAFAYTPVLNKMSAGRRQRRSMRRIAASGQVFLGNGGLQFQANSDVVRLIDQLELGCIRFVYFSEENELRSRGFAETSGTRIRLELSHLAEERLVRRGSRATVTADREPPVGSAPPALINTDTSRVTFKGELGRAGVHRGNTWWATAAAPIPAAAQNRIPMMMSNAVGRPRVRSACPAVTTRQSEAGQHRLWPARRTPPGGVSDASCCNVRSEQSPRLPRGASPRSGRTCRRWTTLPLAGVAVLPTAYIGAVSEMLLIMRQYGERSVLLYSALTAADLSQRAGRRQSGPRLEPSPAFVAAKLLSLPAGYAPTRLAIAGLIADCRLLNAALSFVLLPAAAFGTVAKSEDRLKGVESAGSEEGPAEEEGAHCALAAGDAALLATSLLLSDSTGNWSALLPIESAISYYQYYSLSMENVTPLPGSRPESIAALDLSMRSRWRPLPELGLHVWLPLILWLLALEAR
uniref:Protein kinase domain-containing protein n=1 Tax=Macrostomum lignano TaxID=282301 RepID=A0A1I8FKX8_9PLAT